MRLTVGIILLSILSIGFSNTIKAEQNGYAQDEKEFSLKSSVELHSTKNQPHAYGFAKIRTDGSGRIEKIFLTATNLRESNLYRVYLDGNLITEGKAVSERSATKEGVPTLDINYSATDNSSQDVFQPVSFSPEGTHRLEIYDQNDKLVLFGKLKPR